MTSVKVRHALVTYPGPDGHTETAFRGQVVDIPEGKQLDRLREHDAVVDEDEELDQPGEIISLPAVPSPGEIVSWVASATLSEFESMVATRPDLAEQLNSARVAAEAAHAKEMERLGAAPAASTSEPSGSETPQPPAPPANDTTSQPPAPPTAVNLNEIVAGNVNDVITFLASNPGEALNIGIAEEARATAAGTEPRIGVMRAVEVAMAHTTS